MMVVQCYVCGCVRIKEEGNSKYWHLASHGTCSECSKLTTQEQIQKAYDYHLNYVEEMKKKGAK